MSASTSLSGEMTFRPNAWRYAGFRLVTLLAVYGVLLAALQLMRLLGADPAALPRFRLLDLLVVAGVLFLLDVVFALKNARRTELKLSQRGVWVERGVFGAVTIPWAELDWPHTQHRSLFDRLLGQRYIIGQHGQRIFWQQVAFDPADVEMILDQMARRLPQD